MGRTTQAFPFPFNLHFQLTERDFEQKLKMQVHKKKGKSARDAGTML
jgi:hypothetical protein